MSYFAKVGAFNVGTGSVGTTIPISGLGFEPKILIFWWSGRTESSDTASRTDHRRGMGFAISPSSRVCVFTSTDDGNTGGSVKAGYHHNAACIGTLNLNATTIDGLADLDSIDSDGFTIIIDDQFGTDIRVHYLVLGGTDITNVFIGSYNWSAGTGNQDITTIGWQPDAVLFLGTADFNDAPSALDNAMFCFGAAAGPSTPNNAVLYSYQATGGTPAKSYCRAGECLALQFNPPGTVENRGAISAWLSDGFRVNKIETTFGSARVHYLAIQGGQYAVGNLLTQTDTSTVIEEIVDITPKGILFASHGAAESTADTVQANMEASIGAASSPSARGSQAVRVTDATSPHNVTTAIEHDEVYINTAASGAVDGLMDVTDFLTDGFRCIMDDADPDQAFVWYFLAGVVPSGTGAGGQHVTAQVY